MPCNTTDSEADLPATSVQWRSDNLGVPLLDLEDEEAVGEVLGAND